MVQIKAYSSVKPCPPYPATEYGASCLQAKDVHYEQKEWHERREIMISLNVTLNVVELEYDGYSAPWSLMERDR